MLLEPVREEDTKYYKFVRFIADLIEKPVTWFRESIVEPNREDYAWYHEHFRRVPTVDECSTNDPVCVFEADQQFRRDRLVDYQILKIMRRRYENCNFTNTPDHLEMCEPLFEQWMKARTNYFIKYGDLGHSASAIDVYMKQKHRMIWERRNGPVGAKGAPEYLERFKWWPF